MRLENGKKKKEVTVNKNKLKRCSTYNIYVYIEKDLTWGERQTQMKISK